VPIHYEIDAEEGVIRTRCVGEVRFDDVLDHFRTLENDPDLPKRLDVLLDLGPLTSLPESRQMKAAAREIDRLGERIRWGACAIVAERDAVFGMSRMFEVFAESVFARTMTFRERSKAENWLAGLRGPLS
jgi:hypothetical protein